MLTNCIWYDSESFVTSFPELTQLGSEFVDANNDYVWVFNCSGHYGHKSFLAMANENMIMIGIH